MSIAENIRYLRKKQGWGQDVLADKLGYKSYTTIQKWESGVSEPPLKVVHALADIFHVDINDLATVNLETAGKTNQPTEPDGLTEKDIRLVEWFRSLPEEKQKAILSLAGAPEDLSE